MKTLLIFLLIFISLQSCKKKEVKPADPEPDPVPAIVCTDKAPVKVGTYYTYTTGSVDSCYITFIANTCQEKSYYRIVGLYGVFDSWAVEIQDRDYYPVIGSSNKASILDTLNMEFIKESKFLLISMKYRGTFTPNLSLKKLE